MRSGLEWLGVAAIALGAILMLALAIETSQICRPNEPSIIIGGAMLMGGCLPHVPR
jgi:hypothetical protein